jgi:hypothetical protein
MVAVGRATAIRLQQDASNIDKFAASNFAGVDVQFRATYLLSAYD